MKQLLSLLATTLFLFSCGGDYTLSDRGVTVKVKQHSEDSLGYTSPRLVRLEVMGERLIRVSATAERDFRDPESLIILPQDKVAFTVEQHSDTVTLHTSALAASVVVATGEVFFADSAGQLITREREGGGKLFRPYSVTQTHADGRDETYRGWTTQTIFESPDDEAFYGLGQHQADEWNYKGRNEELFQYNTKVSIPFVVSSRGYGILLDSYSLCRFGNPDDYQQLHRVFRLYDANGRPGSLTGTYSAAENITLTRQEDSLYFENLRSARNLPDFPLQDATVVYEGEIEPLETGEYRFSHYYSGYQRILIDGHDVYDPNIIWRTAWNPNARKFALHMEKGRRYSFRLEWRPDGGEAYCGLRAYSPVGSEQQNRLSLWSEMTKQLDYYFILGPSADEVIAGYRTLTGRAQIMPEWLLGYWQSRERYQTQDEILDALRGFRSRHLPIDNIVMDWNYWKLDSWGSFEFDPDRFADPKGMVDSIHSQNAQIMISCWPKYYLTVDNFRELDSQGMIYQQSVKDSLLDWLGFHYAFYDAYNPDARRIFWRQLYERLGVLGIDAWWMDASEPNIRDCTDLPYRKLLCGPTYLGSSDEYFNAYSIVNAEAIYDGQRSSENANRVFLLTRNGFASQQRYSTATWSGDIGTRWEDLKAQITAGLNFSISGIPYWSMDIGGFSVEKRFEQAQRLFDETGRENDDLKEWRELNTRWHQFGMFVPMYRAHGQFPYREPWNIAPESHPAYRAINACLDMRYRLMPYLYSLAADVHFHHYTIMRPLVMDFARDPRVRNIGYQYMFGPSIMVSPVYEYKARSREVYFPEGVIWYDLLTGRVESDGGESKTIAAPYDHIPLHVRAGAIIPYGPKIEYTRQRPADDIRLFVYTGADGAFTLYEDEGTNYNYETGLYSLIPITYDDATRTLTIHPREGQFPGMLTERTFTIIPVSPTAPRAYNPDAEGIKIRYKGGKESIKL